MIVASSTIATCGKTGWGLIVPNVAIVAVGSGAALCREPCFRRGAYRVNQHAVTPAQKSQAAEGRLLDQEQRPRRPGDAHASHASCESRVGDWLLAVASLLLGVLPAWWHVDVLALLLVGCAPSCGRTLESVLPGVLLPGCLLFAAGRLTP